MVLHSTVRVIERIESDHFLELSAILRSPFSLETLVKISLLGPFFLSVIGERRSETYSDSISDIETEIRNSREESVVMKVMIDSIAQIV